VQGSPAPEIMMRLGSTITQLAMLSRPPSTYMGVLMPQHLSCGGPGIQIEADLGPAPSHLVTSDEKCKKLIQVLLGILHDRVACVAG